MLMMVIMNVIVIIDDDDYDNDSDDVAARVKDHVDFIHANELVLTTNRRS